MPLPSENQTLGCKAKHILSPGWGEGNDNVAHPTVRSLIDPGFIETLEGAQGASVIGIYLEATTVRGGGAGRVIEQAACFRQIKPGVRMAIGQEHRLFQMAARGVQIVA